MAETAQRRLALGSIELGIGLPREMTDNVMRYTGYRKARRHYRNWRGNGSTEHAQVAALHAPSTVRIDNEIVGLLLDACLPASLGAARCLSAGGGEHVAAELRRRGALEVIEVEVSQLLARDHSTLGRFDLVIAANLLSSGCEPVAGLEHLHGLCRGELVALEACEPDLDLHPELRLARLSLGAGMERWRLASSTYARLIQAAGFQQVTESGRAALDDGRHQVVFRAAASSGFRFGPPSGNSPPAPRTNQSLRRERRIRFGAVEVLVAMPERLAERISRTRSYRLFRPAVRFLLLTLTHRGRTGPGAPSSSSIVPTTAPRPEDQDPEMVATIQQVARLSWYHSIDVGRGVVTPGLLDNRGQFHVLPASLSGLDCIDLGSADGFWAFEMERRGAARVVAVDLARNVNAEPTAQPLDGGLCLPADGIAGAGKGFEIAHKLLGSSVIRHNARLEDLDPNEIGRFDVVVVSDLLLHLRSPIAGLERVLSICRGAVLIEELFDPSLDRYEEPLARLVAYGPSHTWWLPGSRTWCRMLEAAGFVKPAVVARHQLDWDRSLHQAIMIAYVPPTGIVNGSAGTVGAELA